MLRALLLQINGMTYGSSLGSLKRDARYLGFNCVDERRSICFGAESRRPRSCAHITVLQTQAAVADIDQESTSCEIDKPLK
jgi:hypothetical protein